ncbi:MAG TPA: BatA domain-containing protein [Bryobacteraceae bacterium]|nr:BatA domain-containing protein [Bryobacteraceae bacterium]
MGFLAPWFLAGAAAIGLPIWLHFLRRSKTNPQPFSSLMFFERRTETSVQPKRLRYLALLALRVALLILLALAFANPFLSHTTVSPKRKQLTVIAIDRSFSMRAGDHMQRARALAQNIADQLPNGTLAQAVALDSHVEDLTQPDVDRSAVKSALAAVQPTDLASSYAEFVHALRAMEQNSGMALNVHLVSDMQQTSMPGAFTDLQLGPHTSLTLHRVAADPVPNWSVESVSGTMRIFDAKSTHVAAIVAGYQTPAATRKVSLVLDNKVFATKEVSVPANGRAQVDFLGFPVSYGSHRAEVRMQPGDALPADDSFRFPVEHSDPATVLFLSNGQPRDAFYFKAAMESDPNSGLKVQAVNAGQAENEELNRYAFVVLSDNGRLSEALERRLDSYVRHGGALLVLLGPEAARAGRSPLTNQSLSPDTETQGASFVDNGYPPLAGLGQLANVQFYISTRINAPSGARVFAKLADGSPLLIEQNLGEGRVLQFASTFDNAGNDFPLHKTFLPFVAQTGRYLAESGDLEPSVTAGTPVELRRSRQSGAAADVIGPDGKHELSLHQAASAMDFVPRIEGFYEIQRANGQRSFIAVHSDRRESDLTPIPAETLALWRNTGNQQSPVPAEAAAGENRQTQHQPLWRFLLILLVGIGITESIFASRYLREERSPHDSSRTTERVLAKT